MSYTPLEDKGERLTAEEVQALVSQHHKLYKGVLLVIALDGDKYLVDGWIRT